MSAEAIQITYLPKGITADEIRNVLLSELNEVFGPHRQHLSVQVYEDGKATSAVVKGFSSHFEKLLFKFRRVTFTSAATNMTCTNVNIKLDTGEERTKNGRFQEERSPSFRQKFEKMGGISARKVVKFFNGEFLAGVDPIYTGFQTNLYLKNLLPKDLHLEELNKPGQLCTFKVFQNNTGTMLRYGCELETLQAIAYINNNPKVVNTENDADEAQNFVLPIYNVNLTRQATINFKKGLGVNGDHLKIEELHAEHGFIPVDEFNCEIKDDTYKVNVERHITCINCEGSYNIIGVSPFLNSFACRCSCYYGSRPVTENQKKAIFWNGERFTRIMLTGQRDSLKYCVQYQPVKRTYSTTEDYLHVQLPLLYEEWKFLSEEFKRLNAITGIVTDIRIVEGCEDEINGIYALKILISETSEVWMAGNPSCIRKLTLVYKQNGLPIRQWKKAKLFRMVSASNGLMLYVQVTMNERNQILLNERLHIIPKPNKCEYNGTKAALNTWNKAGNRYELPLTKVLLNPLLPADDWILPQDTITKNIHFYLIERSLENWIKKTCNEYQITAVNKALKSNVSFIHGPPGTGKTFTLAVIINMLYHREKGTIIVAAPSNFASDGIAESILSIHPHGFPPPRILRIQADSKEEYPQVVAGIKLNERSAVLHTEVQRTDEWLNTDECKQIANRARANNLVLLKPGELDTFRAHKRGLEKEIMNEYDVFVLTVGALADKRVEAWAKDQNIATIVIDEAGQLKHPSTVTLFGIKAYRYIFAGDPEQLSPTIESKSAKLAGLDMSIMDIIYLCEAMKNRQAEMFPPWTTLLVQHRMHPEIRKFSSMMFYNDKLTDSSIHVGDTDEDTCMIQKLYEKRVVALDHEYLETQDGFSRLNEGEATIIVNKVEELLKIGVNPHKIVILTFYESQKRIILHKLAAKKLNLSALNVDAFQGRESAIVFLSLTRSNKTGDIGFAANPNRLCVALSRAQQYLFIAGNLQFYEKLRLQVWKMFCYCVRNGAMIVNCKA